MPKVVKVENAKGMYVFDCPGCGFSHAIYVKGNNQGAQEWDFNFDYNFPTVNPSIRVRWTEGENRIEKCCHSFVIDGKIRFLNDCTHHLAGKTVELKDI